MSLTKPSSVHIFNQRKFLAQYESLKLKVETLGMVESERDKLRDEIGGLQVRVSAVPSLKADVQYLEGRLKSTSDLLENRVYNLN